MSGDAGQLGQRLDQWLCFARIAKSRTLAQELIGRGKVRVNRVHVDKASQTVKAGDVITISLGPRVRVLRVTGAGKRRGPAPEAAMLYEEIVQPAVARADRNLLPAPAAVREPGAGRPTKRDRRALDRLKTTPFDD